MKEFEDVLEDFDKFIKKYPKEATKFIKKEAKILKKNTQKKAKSLINVTKGKRYNKKGKEVVTYMKGFNVGKPFKSEDGTTIRVYNKSNHAHWIESGTVTRNNKKGSNRGFMKGFRILEKAKIDFKEEFEKDCIGFVDDIIEKGGF